MPNPARPTKPHPETPLDRWQTAGAKNYFFALLVADFCCCFCLFVFWVFFGLLSPTCCLLCSRFVSIIAPFAARCLGMRPKFRHVDCLFPVPRFDRRS